MSATIDETDLTSAQEHGPPRWVRDIPQVDTLTSFKQDYWQLKANHTPETLDTAHPTEAGFYLVNESPLRPLGGGIVEFTREYARIPDEHTVPMQFAWRIPGLGSEDPPGSVVSISSFSGTPTAMTFTTAADSGATAGDEVAIKYTVSTPTGQVSRTVLRGVTAGTSSSVTTAPVTDSWPITFISLQKIVPGRDPEVIPVHSELRIDYFLPGVNVSSMDNIPILIEYANIYDATGRKAESFTETTSPTLSDYRSLVANESQIVVERSHLQYWKGNIVRRTTRYSRAI